MSPSVLKSWLLGQSTTNHHQHLVRHNILLLDGGVSTHLQAQGATFGHRALWSSSLLLTEPQRVLDGHVDWLQQGHVNLISTVTYQCHYQKDLWPDVIRDERHMDDLWRQAVALAQQAVTQTTEQETTDRYYGIVASSGCFGAALANGAEYTGDYGAQTTTTDLQTFHGRKLQIMQQLPVDAVAIETIPSLPECQALRDLFQSRTEPPPMACWISLSCRNGKELNDGTPVEQALQVLEEIPMDAVQAFGFNCCHAHDLPSLLGILTRHYQQQQQRDTSSPRRRGIVLYPNSGETWDAATQDWKPGTACDDMAQFLMDCIKQVEQDLPEARIIVGGCCRTTPALLAALRVRVDQHLAAKE